MEIIIEKISIAKLRDLSEKMFGSLVKEGEDFIEFDSVINIRPSQKNRSRGVEDMGLKRKILEITNKLIEK